MKLPPLKRILKTDIQEATNTLNNYLQVVWQALDRRLSFGDNLDCQLVPINVVGGSTAQISTTLGRPLRCLAVLSVQGDAPLTAGVTARWRQVEKTVQIQQFTGLAAGEPYQLLLLLL